MQNCPLHTQIGPGNILVLVLVVFVFVFVHGHGHGQSLEESRGVQNNSVYSKSRVAVSLCLIQLD